MRTSVGLLPDQHICPRHSAKMQPVVEYKPKFVIGYACATAKRVVWHCPAPGCYFVAIGEQEYIQGAEEKKTVSSLSRRFA